MGQGWSFMLQEDGIVFCQKIGASHVHLGRTAPTTVKHLPEFRQRCQHLALALFPLARLSLPHRYGLPRNRNP